MIPLSEQVQQAWWRQYKYLGLLLILVTLVTLHPLLEGYRHLEGFFALCVSAMLFASIVLLGTCLRSRLLGLAVALPEVLAIWWYYATGSHEAELAKYAFFVLFHLYAAVSVYRDLSRQTRITVDEVRGAVCLYMLIGAGWSALYYIVHLLSPGAFHVLSGGTSDQAITWFDLLYYSFVTLASLGFGDITPVTAIPRTLTILESIMGLFYMAVIVATMVSQLIRGQDGQLSDAAD
jgi:Ion channel